MLTSAPGGLVFIASGQELLLTIDAQLVNKKVHSTDKLKKRGGAFMISGLTRRLSSLNIMNDFERSF
jgi:hypothetical protein